MSEYEGFKPCEKIEECTTKKAKWTSVLREFFDSGDNLVCKEYDDDELAKEASQRLHNAKKDFNERIYTKHLRNAEKANSESFVLPQVEVYKRGNTIYLQRITYEVYKMQGANRFPHYLFTAMKNAKEVDHE